MSGVLLGLLAFVDPNAFALALTVAIPAVAASTIAPIMLSRQAARQRLEEQRAQWERDDRVAAKAAKVASTLAESTEVANTKLDQIHTLVNSHYTAALQAELSATERELALMRELIALKELGGRAANGESKTSVERTQKKIDELKATIAERLEQTEVADKQAASQDTGGGETT